MRFGALVVIGLVAMAALARADWDVVEIGGRDYVPGTNVAEFYGIGAFTPGPKVGGKSTFGAEGGGKTLKLKEDSRESLINGTRQWLAFPVVVRGGVPHVSRIDVAKVLDPAMRPGADKDLPRVLTVVLDPGHGGHDKGASSRFGYEKEFTLDLTARVRKRLEKAGLKVVQTRKSDVFVELESRPRVADRYQDAIFVSLHFNSADWRPAATGVEIFTLSGRGTPPTGQSKVLARDLGAEKGHATEDASVALANAMYPSLLAGTQSFDRGVKRARFSVLRHAKVPAVLIEGGFLTNPAEAARVASTAWRDKLADAIVQGILAYKALTESGAAPKGVGALGGRPTTEFLPPD